MENRIKELREAMGWSQVQLGEKLGVHFNTVGNWEDGTSEPKSSMLAKMASLFGCSVEHVMGLPDMEANQEGDC